jgi:hypothetical protein
MRLVRNLLSLFMLCGSMAFATPAFVANATACTTTTDASTHTCSYTPTSGNTIVVWTAWGQSAASTPTLSSCSATGYTFSIPVQKPDNTTLDGAGVCVATNVPAGAATITVTLSATSSGGSGIWISEYSGVANPTATDGTNSANTTGSSASAGSITTGTNGDLILSAFFDTTTIVDGFTVGSGFTIRWNFVNGSTAPTSLMSEDQVQAIAGAISGTATAANGTDRWIGLVFALKPTGTGGTTRHRAWVISQ